MKIVEFLPVAISKRSPKTINEARPNVDDAVKRIKRLLGLNNHIGITSVLAHFLGDKKYITIADSLYAISELDRDSNPTLTPYAKELTKSLLKDIEKKYGRTTRIRLWAAS
jgi:hypothetical protein